MVGQQFAGYGARGGMVVSPEHRASEVGRAVLEDGGTAIEAVVAVAAALGVTYPHMTGMGGDAFWLVQRPGEAPVAIMGCGAAAEAANLDLYAGSDTIPVRGPLAANTVAGAVSSWQAALALPGAAKLGLHRVLRDAIDMAADGVEVSPGLKRTIAAKQDELCGVPGWAGAFGAANGTIRNVRLARTMEMLRTKGLQSFYTNGIADEIAQDLAEVGSPVSVDDLRYHRASVEKPLTVRLKDCTIASSPPPTQGFASLMILALIDQLDLEAESFEQVHAIVEGTKLAFSIRNREIHDPAYMTLDAQAVLNDAAKLGRMVGRINPAKAAAWPCGGGPGDTTWIGAADAEEIGRAHV
jgi:gamma-glutamyltranspeptidase/glutathione hydrolase